MGGYNYLVAVSGIDGSFREFDQMIVDNIKSPFIVRYSYDKSKSFVNNVLKLRKTISAFNKNSVTIVGWSIGAVASAFVSDISCIKACVMINPFYNRREILEPRGIFCDEDVLLSEAPHNASTKIIINGTQDKKIPIFQTSKVIEHYRGHGTLIHVTFKNASHSLSTFPSEEISAIINKYSEYEYDDNCC